MKNNYNERKGQTEDVKKSMSQREIQQGLIKI